MGFNTIAFLLNDLSHTLDKSPKSVVHLLKYPPLGYEQHPVERSVDGEPPVHSQALEVLKTWHADERKFFTAGMNCIDELKFVRFGKSKDGKITVTLEMPDWYQERYNKEK